MSDYNVLSAQGWHLTNHLRKRAAERGISEAEVLAVLTDPEVIYDQRTYGPNRQVRQGGRLGLVVDSRTGAVITVVFRDRELWLHQLSSVAVAA